MRALHRHGPIGLHPFCRLAHRLTHPIYQVPGSDADSLSDYGPLRTEDADLALNILQGEVDSAAPAAAEKDAAPAAPDAAVAPAAAEKEAAPAAPTSATEAAPVLVAPAAAENEPAPAAPTPAEEEAPPVLIAPATEEEEAPAAEQEEPAPAAEIAPATEEEEAPPAAEQEEPAPPTAESDDAAEATEKEEGEIPMDEAAEAPAEKEEGEIPMGEAAEKEGGEIPMDEAAVTKEPQEVLHVNVPSDFIVTGDNGVRFAACYNVGKWEPCSACESCGFRPAPGEKEVFTFCMSHL